MKTSGENNSKKSLFGGSHLKRVSISIQSKNDPENVVIGYALSHEILSNQVSFFAAQKFPVEEELIITYYLNGEKKSLTVMMKHMHEQISSGRIMNAVPSEDNPFPARKFYRCYSSVVAKMAAVITSTEEEKQPQPIAAAEIVEEAPAPKENIMNVFAAEPVASAEIPDVDEGLQAA